MSRLHLPGLYLSVWEEDRLKDGLVNRQLYWMTDKLWVWWDRQTDRKTGTQPKCQAESQADIQCRHSRRRANHCHSVQSARGRQRAGKKAEEHPGGCSFWRISVSAVASSCTKKNPNKQWGREGGLLLQGKYRLGRGRARGTEVKKQRERAGVGNPPLHLLVIYSFMLSRRLPRWLVFCYRRSSAYGPTAIPKKTRGGQTEETRIRQQKKGKGGAFSDWLIFTCSFCYLSRWALVIFVFAFF